MSSRITLGPPLLGSPMPSDAPFSVAFGERHGEGARQVTALAVVADGETAELFRRVLSRDRLILAGDIAEGIALAEAEAPEVVFVDVGVAEGAGLAILATLRANLGSLDRVKRVVKTLGMVNSSADFTNHPEVINGCSELWAQVWGAEHGVGARSAVGMGSLPRNSTVEVEAIFELA